MILTVYLPLLNLNVWEFDLQTGNESPRILIVGATSAIAREAARLYAARGANLFLIGRNGKHLQDLAQDLRIRGAGKVELTALDLNEFDQHKAALDAAIAALGGLDLALVCHGSLPDQQACEQNFVLTQKEINTNGLSVLSLLTNLAGYMSAQQNGTIAVITSVAGDRGRQSNFVYGSAKAMVSTWLQGLRGRLLRDNVHVVDIRPGFVDSPMTAQFKKGFLWSSPARIAAIMVKAIDNKRHTVYAPFYWRFIMFAVRMLPEFLFKRMRL